jgi:integrase
MYGKMSNLYQRKWITGGIERVAWRVEYVVGGKTKQRQFKTKRLAKRFQDGLSVFVHQEEKKALTAASPTVAEAASVWLRACETGRDGTPPLEPTTVDWYRSLVRLHIIPVAGDLRLGHLTPSQCREVRNEIIDRCQGRTTAKHVYGAFRAILRHGVTVEYLTHDPSAGIHIKMNRREQGRRIVIHDKEDMRRIVEKAFDLSVSNKRHVQRTWIRGAAFLSVLVYTGLRLSEVRGIPVNCVNLLDGYIEVTQRADARGHLGPPKTARARRKIFLPQVAVEALRKLLEDSPAVDHELVFRTGSGRPLSSTYVTKLIWNEIQRRAGVRRLNLHSIRHFYASRLIEQGTSVKEVAASLGHADEAFTLRVYGHLFTDLENEKARRMRAESLTLGAARP